MSIARKDLKGENFKGITTGRHLAAVHPGTVLAADFIEPMGLTRYRVAKAIGVQQRRIDEICAGERGITADTAVRLGLAFGIDPQFWLNLQAQYDIEIIQREHGDELAEEVASLTDAE
jgi:addiction module HigA family antidote